MRDDRPWYREPESFIALAALVVSVSAVVVGIYEASLQRTHDRAEVWPHVELATVVSSTGATLSLENGGIGPAIIKSVVITVDSRSRRQWDDVLAALMGSAPKAYSHVTVVDHALRAGEKTVVLALDGKDMPPQFWQAMGRVGVTICYSSVFNESWELIVPHVGGVGTWRTVDVCPAQAVGVEF